MFDLKKIILGGLGLVASLGFYWLLTRKMSHVVPISTANVQKNVRNEAVRDLNRLQYESVKPPLSTAVDISKQGSILFGKYGHFGETVGVVSPAGGGKTILSIGLCENPQVRKALIFTFDDPTEKQFSRYTTSPAYHKMTIVTYSQWEKLMGNFKQSLEKNCENKAVVEFIAYGLSKIIGFDVGKIIRRKDQLVKELGLSSIKTIWNVLLLDMILASEVGKSHDLVIIDSVNALFEHPSKMTRRNFEEILQHFRGTNRTLIFLHHTNKKLDFYGNSEFGNIIDTLLFLEPKVFNGSKYCVLRQDKVRYDELKEETILQFVKSENGYIHLEMVDDSVAKRLKTAPNLRSRILEILENLPSSPKVIKFQDLENALKSYQLYEHRSVLNELKRLEGAGFVEKGNGTSWDSIVFLG